VRRFACGGDEGPLRLAAADSESGRVVREMPLWRLQRIGREEFTFLYEHQGDGHVIRLQTGVAYCLRKFHALISDLVRGAWVRYVRGRTSTCSARPPI
jgi:hypothetical protein